MSQKTLFCFNDIQQLCFRRYRFNDHLFLNTLSSLLEVIYTDGEGRKDLVSLSTIHMMTSTHSLFLPTMLDPGEEPRYSSKGMTSADETFQTSAHFISSFLQTNPNLLSLQKLWCLYFSVW